MLGSNWKVPYLRPTPGWLPGQPSTPGDQKPYPNSPSWTRFLNPFLFPCLLSSKHLNSLTGLTFDEFYEQRDLTTKPYWQNGGAAGCTK